MKHTSTNVKEGPITFPGPMVRAILDGRKTQTRQVLKLPKGTCWYDGPGGLGGEEAGYLCDDGTMSGPGWWHVSELWCPYGSVGDRLWVREAWASKAHVERGSGTCFAYRADGEWKGRTLMWKWNAPPSMPRHASRITLEIADVRVERLWEITKPDCIAEGIRSVLAPNRMPMWDQGDGGEQFTLPRLAFSSLWETNHGKGSWGLNPWAWAITFRRVE